jgi:uncharacterized protein YbjT (DUF2867 family)
MSNPILVTGAAGGSQGSTGKTVVRLLSERGLPVRALVHRLDERANYLRGLGAEVVQGDLLVPASVRKAMQGVKRAYFTYPVTEGLLEATAIFAAAAREAGTELVVNMSQFQSTPDAPSFRNLQHRLADQVFDWAQVGAVHLNAPPFYENVRALIAQSVAEQDTIYLPWGGGEATFPLIGADDVARVAAALLTGPVPGRQNRYDLIGEVTTVSEIVNSVSTALKRPVRYVEITDEQWLQAGEGRLDPHALDHLSHLWSYFRTSGIRKGEHGFRVSETISALTGAAPQTLEQFIEVNADAFGGVGPRER